MSPWLRATYSAQARLSERGFRASRPVVRCGAVGSHRRSSRLGRLRTLRSRCLTAAITEVCPCWRLPNLGFRAAGSSVRLMFRRRPDRAHLFQRPRVSSFERESPRAVGEASPGADRGELQGLGGRFGRGRSFGTPVAPRGLWAVHRGYLPDEGWTRRFPTPAGVLPRHAEDLWSAA